MLWTGLSPHPLVTLISTILLLERLVAIYPEMGAEGECAFAFRLVSFALPLSLIFCFARASVISKDACLRVAFASFLIALKWSSDVSYTNATLATYTPGWSLTDVNVMEQQLLRCLNWDIYIDSDE